MSEQSEEDTNRRKSRLAVFEQVSNPDKNRGNTGIKRRLRNAMGGQSESEAVVDDDFEDDNLMIASKRSRRGIRFVDEPLNLTCLWTECSLSSTDFKEYNTHVINHLDGDDYDKDGMECMWERCSFIAPSAPYFIKHLSFHAYHSKLKNIGENIVERNKLPPCTDSAQMYEVPGIIADYLCEWDGCNCAFYNLYDFFIHVKMHVNGNPKICKKGEFVNCDWNGCSSKFVTQYKLSDHVRVHTKERCVACPTCENLFATKTKFADHRKRQLPTEMQTYQCSQCSKLFPTERLLREHIRSHINHYKCTMCDMTCPTPSTLAKHIRFRHINERPYKCTKCDHASISKLNMDMHMTTHIAEKLMVCDECDFTCRSMYGLERHYNKIHGEGNVKNYECHNCGKRFARGNHLTKHLMRKHGYSWPSGHSRFRYKEDSEGIFRLQTVRYESLEVTQEMIDKNKTVVSTNNSSTSNKYILEKQSDSSNKQPASYVLLVSETGENIVCPTDKSIVITIDDVDEKGNLVKSETVHSKEIVSADDILAKD